MWQNTTYKFLDYAPFSSYKTTLIQQLNGEKWSVSFLVVINIFFCFRTFSPKIHLTHPVFTSSLGLNSVRDSPTMDWEVSAKKSNGKKCFLNTLHNDSIWNTYAVCDCSRCLCWQVGQHSLWQADQWWLCSLHQDQPKIKNTGWVNILP